MTVETLALPIVMKAIDFLFDQAKALLDERRAARRKPDAQLAVPPDIPLLEQDKASVMHRRVSAELAQRKQQAMEGLLNEIAIYEQNYVRLKKRVALEGGMDYAPISVVNQLQAQEDAIMDASERLAALVDELVS